ncbi:MAG: hypothetical protein U0228_22795 [Myxococcaceae bacterium]
MRMQDAVAPIFANGPGLTDRDFSTWVARQSLVKLPFTIWRTPQRVAAMGVVDTKPAETLRLDDSALGIALDERLRQLCKDEDPCRVWLSGRLAPPGFSVVAVHEKVQGAGPFSAQAARGPECLAIRLEKPIHCARGPSRCEKCRAAAAQPATPRLLDLCPYGDAARPTLELTRDGKKRVVVFDVLRSFTDVAEAKAFASAHHLTEVEL